MTGRFSRSHYKTFRQTCTLEAALQAPDSAVAAKAAFAVRRLRRRLSAFINAVAALLDGGAKVVRPAQRWLRLAINGPAENRPYIIPPGPWPPTPPIPPAGTRLLRQHHLTTDGGVSSRVGLTFPASPSRHRRRPARPVTRKRNAAQQLRPVAPIPGRFYNPLLEETA